MDVLLDHYQRRTGEAPPVIVHHKNPKSNPPAKMVDWFTKGKKLYVRVIRTNRAGKDSILTWPVEHISSVVPITKDNRPSDEYNQLAPETRPVLSNQKQSIIKRFKSWLIALFLRKAVK
jgi:hypothetical protein